MAEQPKTLSYADVADENKGDSHVAFQTIIHIVCILLSILSILPFWIMIVNATRSTTEIQQHALSLIPSSHMVNNFKILTGKSFKPTVGLTNSVIISSCSTILNIYFSSLTAYALVAYQWKLRIDGAGEFRIFNTIVLPIMKPALATQAIFGFVGKWNDLFTPLVLLTKQEKYTMPIMVSLLRGDIYKTEYGSVYMGLTLTVLPLIIVYLLLSKYIIAGVALGGVKG